MFRFNSSLRFMGALILLLALLVGCGGKDGDGTPAQADTQPPTAAINAPTDQALLEAGRAIQVNVVANDDQAIVRIELYVDNSLIESRVTPSGSTLTTRSEQFTWSASMMGPHTLQARAYDERGQMGASRIVVVNVGLAGETPSGGNETPDSTRPAEGATPTSIPPTQPTATATPESALVTANVNANVRGGPGTNYHVAGGLGEGESALVTGRNANSSWWQISYQGRAAWVADSVVTANSLAHNAPVASAPPPPPTDTPVPSTATPPPTATSGPSGTPIPTTGFRVDQTSLNAGQCTTLRWDFDNIKAIHVVLGYGYDEEGIAGHGTSQVCPSITTTYKARVIKNDNSQQTHEVTVNVNGGGCGDPWITRFVPTAYDVKAGQKFSVFWDVECAKTVRYIKGGGGEQAVAGNGKRIDETIDSDTTFKLKVEKNGGGFVYASFVVKVK